MRLSLLSALLLAVVGCTQQEKPIGMANPASKNCIRLGGQLEIRRETAGETGYCHLPDGRVVEEWALFRESEGKKPAN